MTTKKKTGLGRGLNTLIPSAPAKDAESEKILKKEEQIKSEIMVPILKVEPNPDQPRRQFDEDSLQELADSIKQYGILQPLIVKKHEKFYEIIAGERRWRAAKLAGLKEVPVLIRDYAENEIVEIALIENIQREDLNPIEEALAYKRLMEEFSLKQDQVAAKVSKSRVAITNSLRLLKLDERVQQMLIDEMLSTGHARALLAIEDKEMQYSAAIKVFDEKLSVRETEKLVKDILNPAEKKPEKKEDPALELIYQQLEEKIKGIVGSKVAIRRKNKDKGRIEIEYYSQDELERIVELLESVR